MPRGKKAIDLTGQRFGGLVARERASDLIYSGRPFTAWRCDCDCGASSIATASGLTRGLTKSCGCLRRETGKFKTLDITGQRYGRLTVVKRVGSRNGKALWSCDCRTRGHETTQNQLQRGHAQSCGCLRDEFLYGAGGLRRTSTIGVCSPRVGVTYPIPENLYPGKSQFFNDVQRRRYQSRWERVEMEVRKIQRGEWKEPRKKPFIPVDDFGNRIIPLDLRGMMKERTLNVPLCVPLPETPASFNTPSSLLDRVRIVTDEEWARYV